jgi:hypothetical protein
MVTSSVKQFLYILSYIDKMLCGMLHFIYFSKAIEVYKMNNPDSPIGNA